MVLLKDLNIGIVERWSFLRTLMDESRNCYCGFARWVPPRSIEQCSEAEKRIPLQIENFGTLMTQVSFVNYDGARVDVP
jgi:hypothetical protein